MKIIGLTTLTMLLTVCASIQTSTAFTLSAKSGHFDEKFVNIPSDKWDYCFKFEMLTAYGNPKWKSSVGIAFMNVEETERVHVRLQPKTKSMEKYTLEYGHLRKVGNTIQTVETIYLDDDLIENKLATLSINRDKNGKLCINGNYFCRDLPFKYRKLAYVGVSSESRVTHYEGRCINI